METPKEWDYKFTVVTPVYQVEEYLKDTIESVINQTVGFQENIQLILVNDGSLDNSEEICLKYQEQYPDNILYLKKENGGVSSARNEAFPYIRGKYVNFLDSDDMWAPDAFEIIYHFFEEHYKKIDVVGGRKRFFEARDDFHYLDYKFDTTKVIYLQLQYDYVQLDVTSAFIKTEALGDHRFSTHLKYGEDGAFINEVLLDKCTLGVVREALHLYRKRLNATSALQNEMKSESYYVDSPKYFHQALFDKSIERYGRVLEFIQYAVMNDLGWRIRKNVHAWISAGQAEQYKRALQGILQKIEERVIMNQKMMYKEYKVYALSLKYGRDIRKELIYDMGKLLFHNIALLDILQIRNMVMVTVLDIGKKKLHLEGRVNTWLPEEDYQIYMETQAKRKRLSCYRLEEHDKKGLDGICYQGKGFRLDIPLEEDAYEITFSIWYKDIYRKKIKFTLEKNVPLNEESAGYYFRNHYIAQKEKKKLLCKRISGEERTVYEKKYQMELIQNGMKQLASCRKWYFMFKKLKKKEIWLIPEELSEMQDRGEQVLGYLRENKPGNAKAYFVSGQRKTGIQKVKKYGRVIKYGSFWHKLLFLLSDKIIVPQKGKKDFDVFGDDRYYMKDLYQFKSVFLE